MKRWVGLVLGVCFASLSYAYQGSNGLVYIPKANMEAAGYSEFGLVSNFYQAPDLGTTKYQPVVYFRYAVSDFFEYNVVANDELQALHSLHANVLSVHDPRTGLGHDLAFGIKNVGWTTPNTVMNEPVYDLFAAYSLSILGTGSSYHVGISRDKLDDHALLYLFGAEYAFPFGVATVEWDGRTIHLGYKYYSGTRGLFFVTISPIPIEREGFNNRYVSLGISFRDNMIERIKSGMVSRKVLDDEITKLNQRISLIESKEKALAEVTSRAFLDELEKQYVDNKLMEKSLKTGSQSLVKGALSHMQRGLEYYYQGNYKLALEEYKIVVSLMPDFAMGHARLGSIYHQLGNDIRAREHWEKAMALNPRNDSLKAHLLQQLNTFGDGAPSLKIPQDQPETLEPVELDVEPVLDSAFVRDEEVVQPEVDVLEVTP